MFLRIIKDCHVTGADRKPGDIVKDDSAAECRNLIGKKLAEALTPEEEASEMEKEAKAAEETRVENAENEGQKPE